MYMVLRPVNKSSQIQGLVVGAFQQGSDDIHALLDVLTDSQLRARGLARGREGSNHERSTILAGLRRRLSMVPAKAYSACLMDRVSSVGEGHRQAAKRRACVKSSPVRATVNTAPISRFCTF